MRPRAIGWAGLVAGLALGCGNPAPLPPVQGRVTYRGEPLGGGTIVFAPDPSRGGSGPLARAEIGPDGRYSLRTGDRPGAVPGWHRVTVAPPAQGGLPLRYADPDTSGHCYEVKPGAPNTIDVRLE